MIYVGFDPGTRHSGIAAVKDGVVLSVASVNATNEEQACERVAHKLPHFINRLLHIDKSIFVVIESQEYRKERSEGNPAQLFTVAHVAGAAYGAVACVGVPSMFVAPMTWKGSVPKLQHHRRTLTRLGWSWTETDGKLPYCVPAVLPLVGGYETISKSSWPDVIDAIGMALWLENKRRES
jgi:hypothetical protein